VNVDDRLAPSVAQKLMRKIIETGTVSYATNAHFMDEMKKDGLTPAECLNCIRAGVPEEPELVKGTWRYRYRTPRMYTVAAFRSNTEISLVTTWRIKG
jgi:hypothetical protein